MSRKPSALAMVKALSAIGGVLCIIGIYVLVNLALVYTLPLSELAGSTLPAADAAQRIFGGDGGRIIIALSLLSLLSVHQRRVASSVAHPVRDEP